MALPSEFSIWATNFWCLMKWIRSAKFAELHAECFQSSPCHLGGCDEIVRLICVVVVFPVACIRVVLRRSGGCRLGLLGGLLLLLGFDFGFHELVERRIPFACKCNFTKFFFRFARPVGGVGHQRWSHICSICRADTGINHLR